MSDINQHAILSVITTVNSKLDNLAIENGQLIFVRDKHMIALDFDDKRTIYTQIEELDTESTRVSLLAPIVGRYYCVMNPPVLWQYQEIGWVQITVSPDDINAHLSDTNNPHCVTPSQIGAALEVHNHDDLYYTESEIDETINEISDSIVELTKTASANYDESVIALSVDGQTITYITGDGNSHTIITQDTNTEYFLATDETSGLTKLYATTGSAEDGTMTQKAITTELNKKVGVSINETQNLLIFTTV